jgi:hypothetical protein
MLKKIKNQEEIERNRIGLDKIINGKQNVLVRMSVNNNEFLEKKS